MFLLNVQLFCNRQRNELAYRCHSHPPMTALPTTPCTAQDQCRRLEWLARDSRARGWGCRGDLIKHPEQQPGPAVPQPPARAAVWQEAPVHTACIPATVTGKGTNTAGALFLSGNFLLRYLAQICPQSAAKHAWPHHAAQGGYSLSWDETAAASADRAARRATTSSNRAEAAAASSCTD